HSRHRRDASPHALDLQQPLLAPQPAAVTAELAVLVHDAVAGDEDGDAVLAVGGADRTAGAGATDRSGQIVIRTSLAVGDVEQRGPDRALEIRAGIRQRQREAL